MQTLGERIEVTQLAQSHIIHQPRTPVKYLTQKGTTPAVCATGVDAEFTTTVADSFVNLVVTSG
jgi:hypothetical protein